MKSKGYKRFNLRPRTTTRLKIRQVYVAAAFAFLLVAGGLIIGINLSSNTESQGAVAGDFRSAASGNWNVVGTWERYDGSAWIAATATPTSSNGSITIQAGHTVNVTANVTVDQVLIESTGTLAINTGTMTLANGTGTDLQVQGTLETTSRLTFNSSATSSVTGTERLKSTGTISMGSSSVRTIASGGRFIRQGGTYPTGTASFLTVSSGGTFEHAMNGGILPLATWSTGSTCEVTGITSTAPTNLTQGFSNLTWRSASQTGGFNFNGALTTINGNFSLESTGSGFILLDQQGNSSTLNIGGNMVISGGTLYGCVNGATTVNVSGNYDQTGGYCSLSRSGGTAYGNSSTGIYVNGHATISGGTLDMSQCDANNGVKGTGLFYVKGNVAFSGSALITATSAQSRGQIYFNGTSEQLYTSQDNVSGRVDFIVNPNAILRLNEQIVKSAGNFTVSNGGGILIGDPNGITLTAASGNVQVTGTRTYNTGADYTYNGNSAQSTGDGLPVLARNLTFNNANLVTMSGSSSASGTLTLNGGLIVTNNYYLGMGSSSLVTGTLNRMNGYVVGNFRRWIANALASDIIFPIGTFANFNPIKFSFTTAPSGGTITAFFTPAEARLEGLPLDDEGTTITTASDCYWSVTGDNGFAGGAYTVNLYGDGITGINDYTLLRMIRRPGTGTPWTNPGTHVPAAGSNAAPVVGRSNLSVLGHYAFGSTNANPLPVTLLYFKAKPSGSRTELTWATAAEKDNDFFTVERSNDGRSFQTVLTRPGAGNSRVTLNYSAFDDAPGGSLVYYRLKQTDFDGKFTYSNIVPVRFDKSNSPSPLRIITIGPNPFKDEFTSRFEMDEAGPVEIVLMDLKGQVVYREDFSASSGQNTFRFTEQQQMPSGTYILSLTGAGTRLTQKLLKL